jgi:16S rRNA (uracil1498-N3)-methyltransferase
MHRFYLPPEQCCGNVLQLTGDQAHHAARVLRIQTNERVTVLDGAGHEFPCRVAEISKREARLEVIEKKTVPPLPCQITLLQAIPKGKIIESIIQKATELGAHRIVPLLSERVATKLDGKAAAAKAAQWQQVALEAIKQCGAAWLPRVETPVTPAEFIARKENFDLSLVGALTGERKHPRKYLDEYQSTQDGPPRSISIWIGPEGDFSQEELNLILKSGALPISLGRLVLRVETAAIYCLSFLNYELQSDIPVD